MIAFDTNLLVRVLVADHAEQVAVVRQLIARDIIFISRTVLLETEWVLRSAYKRNRTELHAFFTALLETDNTVIEDAEAVSHALDWYAQGADLADALHLAACGSSMMHTFDRNFCRDARDAGDRPRSGSPSRCRSGCSRSTGARSRWPAANCQLRARWSSTSLESERGFRARPRRGRSCSRRRAPAD